MVRVAVNDLRQYSRLRALIKERLNNLMIFVALPVLQVRANVFLSTRNESHVVKRNRYQHVSCFSNDIVFHET